MTAPAFADALGVAHAQAGDEARIISLVPSLTELLFDLGLGGQIVGRTTFCVHPRPLVERVRSVGGTKRVNMDKVRAAAATHVLVNIDETPKELAEALAKLGLIPIVTHPIDVADNIELYRMIGGVFGRADEAEILVGRLERGLDELRSRAAAWPERRVLYLIWKQPWMTVSRDTYVSRMLALVGWRTVADDPAVRYPTIDLAAGLDDADLVLFSSEPFAFTEAHLAAFDAEFPAHAGKARRVDGEMLSWYGSRAIAGLGYLGDLADRR